MPGSLKSSVNMPWPVMRRGSSRRLTEAPNIRVTDMGLRLLSAWGACADGLRRAIAHRLSGGAYSGDDILVSSASAEVTFELLAYLFVAGVGVALQQANRRHHHARRTEAALEAMLLPEGVLGGVIDAVDSQALHRFYFGAVSLYGKHH